MARTKDQVKNNIGTFIKNGATESDIVDYIELNGFSKSDFRDTSQNKNSLANILSQFQQGAETTERGLGEVLGVGDLAGDRRIPLTEPRTKTQGIAKKAGEFLAPLPQGFGVPGAAFAEQQLLRGAGRGIGKIAATKAGQGTIKAVGKVVDKISTEVPKVAKARIADIIRLTARIPEEDTIRLLEEGGKILKPEFLAKEFSDKNIKNVSNALTSGFKVVQKKFNEKVTPVLIKSEKEIQPQKIVASLVEDMVDKKIIEIPRKSKIFTSSNSTKNLGRKNIKSGLSDSAGKAHKGVASVIELFNKLPEKISMKEAHLVRQKMDHIVDGSKIGENITASSGIKKFRDKFVAEFPTEYKKVNSEFSEIFDIKDEFIRSRLDNSKIESFMESFNNKNKKLFLRGMKKLDDILPKKEKFMESLKDEISAKAFREIEPKNFLNLGGTAALIGVTTSPGIGLAGGALLSSPRGASVVLRGLRGTSKAAQKGGKSINKILGNALTEESQSLIGQVAAKSEINRRAEQKRRQERKSLNSVVFKNLQR